MFRGLTSRHRASVFGPKSVPHGFEDSKKAAVKDTAAPSTIWGHRLAYARRCHRSPCAATHAVPAPSSCLRPDLDGRPERDGVVDLLDLAIRHGYAAVGPIDHPVQRAEPAHAVLQAVDHDVSARVAAALARLLAVGRVWIGDVKGAVETALGEAVVDRE